MKKIFKFLLIGFSSLFFASCEDVIQIDLDEGSKLFVIDAFVNDLPQDQLVRVTLNDSYFNSSVAPPITNALVTITDLTDNKVFTFNHTGNGNYKYTTGIDSLAKVNHQYKLSVSIEGFEYTALTTQKRRAKIYDIIPELFTENGLGTPVEPYYLCNLLAKDKTDANTDYYWVKTSRNDTLFNGSGDINVSIDGTNGPVNSAQFDSSLFTPPITFLGFKDYQLGDKCKAEVHSISKETYFFFVQASAQINNGGLFATTPENVKTNIVTPSGAPTKAVGWFNMASVDVKEIEVK